MSQLWMLTRKHPPSVGGMQELSFNLVRHMRALRPVQVVAWGGGQWALPWFFMSAFARVLVGLARGRIAVLHLGDPALAALAFLPKLAGVPVVATVHGLDVTYPGRWYQGYLRCFFWKRVDACVCISRHVQALVTARGIDPARAPVIPVGMPAVAPPTPLAECLPALASRLSAGFPVLLSLGRLVERKGVPWFIDEVASRWLPANPDAVLVVAGDGPVGSSRVDLQACKLEYSIVSPK